MKLSSIVRLAGATLTVLSILFLGFFIANHFADILDPLRDLTISKVASLIGASAIFGVLLAGKGMGWLLLINHLSDRKRSLATGLYIHGSTQIMKYVPGNVFHYLGRQMKGTRFGWSQMTIAASSFMEIVLNVGSGILVSFAFLSLIPQQALPEVLSDLHYLTIPLVAILALCLLVFLSRLAGQRMAIASRFVQRSAMARVAFSALAIYSVFFLTSGILLLFCARILDSAIDSHLIGYFLAIYPLAWLAGYLTPGAPGGLGVRETVLVVGLSQVVGEATAVLASLLFRLVSITGEILYFSIAQFVVARYAKNERDPVQ